MADLFETISSMRSVRRFDTAPVEEEKIATMLRCATMAPNASNLQLWRFVVVRSKEIKEELRKVAVEAQSQVMKYLRTDRKPSMYREGKSMTENLPNVPVLIFVFADPKPLVDELTGIAKIGIALHVPSAVRQMGLNLAASTYPAIQNLLLAANGLGLAACMTTNITLREKEAKRILKVPERLRLFSLVYVGYPLRKLKPPSRRPAPEFVHYEGWDSRTLPDKRD